jgi:hypothetical protein
VQPFASVAPRVNVNGPDAVGVPPSTPAADSDIPPGSPPAVRVHVIGAVPPVWVNVTGAYGTLFVPPGTVAELTVIVAHVAVVNGTTTSAAMASGGSTVSASVTWLATTRSVHAVLTGRSVDGARVNVVAGLAVRFVSGTGVPAGHASTNAPAPAFTGSLNVTVRLASTATPVAFAAGVVLETVGAASTRTAGAAPPPEKGMPFTDR